MDTTQVNLLDLIGQDVRLRRAASTGGGEWAGPCPFCGGRDRFRVWPGPPGGNPRYWCRQCGASGDAITYLMRRDRVGFREACARLGLDASDLPPRRLSFAPRPVPRPARRMSRSKDWTALADPLWQQEADRFWTRCWDAFWLEAGGQLSPGREYLRSRGIRDAVAGAFALGYNPRPYRAIWGDAAVWLPVGLVIPHELRGTIWALNVRRMDGQTPKYVKAKGSANSLFLAGGVSSRLAVVLVEGELDALSVWQETRGCGLTVAATGSAGGAFLPQWVALLAGARRVLLAFDADEAGDTAARRWAAALPGTVRLRPTRRDANVMLRAGDDLRAWVMGAIEESKEGICEYQS